MKCPSCKNELLVVETEDGKVGKCENYGCIVKKTEIRQRITKPEKEDKDKGEKQ